MKYHIVQVNEKIKDISSKYNVSVDEIKKLNRHINNIDYIVPGMKLRIPILSEPVSEELKDNFLDIEKYYPKVEDFKEVEIEKKENDNNDNDNNNHNEHITPNMPYYYANPYQYTQYPYQPFNTYQYQPYQPNQTQVQTTPIYYFENLPFRSSNQQPFTSQMPRNDLTIPQYQINNESVKSEYFDKPAFCDPILLEGIGKKYEKYSFKEKQVKDFQEPLFTPPYPVNKNIDDCHEFKMEETKEIKVDLRDFVKKNTTIKKKKKR